MGEQMVSDFANNQIPGLWDLIGLFGPTGSGQRRAANPKIGESAVEEVTDVRSYRTDHKIYEVHVGTKSRIDKVVATDEHPSYNLTVEGVRTYRQG